MGLMHTDESYLSICEEASQYFEEDAVEFIIKSLQV